MAFYNQGLGSSPSLSDPGREGIGIGTKTIRGLVASGADLMQNMYDIKIWFPRARGEIDAMEFGSMSTHNYPITVRATGFEIKDVETPTYDIKYHGMSVSKPKTEINFERKFDLEFREDAAMFLRRRFTAWHMAVSDPVTGGVGNATSFFGKVAVGTIVGEYYSTTVAPPGKVDNMGIFDNKGALSLAPGFNPIAIWTFYNVWVYKVSGAKFNTETADAGKMTVGFCFYDCDMPQYGGNALTTDNGADWQYTGSGQSGAAGPGESRVFGHPTTPDTLHGMPTGGAAHTG